MFTVIRDLGYVGGLAHFDSFALAVQHCVIYGGTLLYYNEFTAQWAYMIIPAIEIHTSGD